MERLLEAVGGSRWVVVTSVLAERRDLHLRVELLPLSDATRPGVWLVSCFKVRQFSLTDFDGGGLNWWHRDHPLLSQYSSPKASLRLPGGHRDRDSVIGILFRAHVQAVDDWIDFDRFVRASGSARGGAGSATVSGPQFLLEAYAQALGIAQIAATVKRHKRRLYWSGHGWSERRYDLSLLHFGNSFIAAERFVAEPAAVVHGRSNRRLHRTPHGPFEKRRR